MDITRKKRIEYALIAALISLVYMAVIYLTSSIYLVADDCAMKAIVSGDMSGTPGAHVMFMNYVLGSVLASLYTCTRSIDWFGLLYLVSITFALWAYVYKSLVISTGLRRLKRLFLVLFSIVLFGFLFYDLTVRMTYTTIATVVGMVAIFFYGLDDYSFDMVHESSPVTDDRKQSWIGHSVSDHIIVAILAILCFVIRYETFLMLSPFILVLIVYKAYRSGDIKSFIANNIALWLVITVSIGMLYIADRNAYKGEYAKAREINYYRSEIQDKGGLPVYDGATDLYESLDIDREEYEILNLCWGMSDAFTVENLKAILEYKNRESDVSAGSSIAMIAGNLSDSIRDNLTTRYKVIFCLILIYIFTVAIKEKNLSWIAVTISALIFASIECIHILRIGRGLDYRLIYSFSLGVVMCGIVLLYEKLISEGYRVLNRAAVKEYKFIGLSNAIFVILMMILMMISQVIMFCGHRSEAVGKYWMYGLEEYYMEHQETLFVTAGIRSEERLDIREPKRRNFIQFGGWVSEMPEFKAAISGEYDSITEGFANRDDLVVVTNNEDNIRHMSDYLNKKGFDSDYVMTDTIERGGADFKLWCFQ